ncbi:MAG: hypothetical protein JOZ75_11510 [Candidatus Dormibacteraeota bacterium]|nr:hypothetical protein [Candidatus Dormibacteraeota bacterium]
MADASPPDFAPPPAAPPAGDVPPPPPPPPSWGAPPPGYGSPPTAWPPPGYGWSPYAWPQQKAMSLGSGRFRAMNLGELFDGTFSLYRRNFVLIAAISAVIQVPYAVIAFVLYQIANFAGLQQQLQNAQQSLANPTEPLTQQQLQPVLNALGPIFLISGILALISIFLVLPLAEAATTRAVSDRYLDRPASIGASYRAALGRLGPLVLQSLILGLGIAVLFAAAFAITALLAAALGAGSIPLILIGWIGVAAVAVMVYVRTSLAAPAIVLERLGGWRGLVRSWNLVSGLFWRLLGIRLLLGLITGIISAIFVFIIAIAGVGLDTNGRFILQEVATAFATVFVSPITYIAVTLLYYDARIRKEGFDIEMLAQTL